MEHHGAQWTDQRNHLKKDLFSSSQVSPEPATQELLGSSTLQAPRPSPIRRSSSDLFERIDVCERFTENEARYIFAQVVSIVSYLQNNRVFHMDLKDENIVIDESLQVCRNFSQTQDQSYLT